MVRAFLSKCEETTTYDKQKMKYSCVCSDRTKLTEEQMKEARETNKKKLKEIEESLAEGMEGKSKK